MYFLLQKFAPYVQFFLFDTKGKQQGGTGIRFNWKLLNGKRFSKPFLLFYLFPFLQFHAAAMMEQTELTE